MRFHGIPLPILPTILFALLSLRIYYVHAEVAYPSLNISLLDYSTSFRQSVCDRQVAISNGTLEFRDALEGLRLNAALTSVAIGGGLMPDGSVPEENPKLDVRMLDELAVRAGFTWRDSFGAVILDDGFNATFNDILDWSTESFDLSAMLWTRTRERINSGNIFPHGFVDGSIILTGRQPSQGRRSLNLWSFLMPFDLWTWLLILATFVICGLIYNWMEVQNHDSDRQELHGAPIETIFFSALTFMGDIKFSPSTNYARLFVISLAVWSLLISSAYTANLASFLSMQSTQQWDIETVEDAVRLQVPICAIESASPAVLVQERFPTARLVLINDFERGYVAAYEALFAGNCRLVLTTITQWERDRRNPNANPHCDLQWVGRVFRFLPAGFATQSDSGLKCTSLVRDVLGLHLIEMDEEGFIEQATKEVLDADAQQDCDGTSDSGATTTSSSTGDGTSDPSADETQLTIQNLGGLFICLYSMIGVSILMAVWNIRNQRATEKKNRAVERAQHDLVLTDEHVMRGRAEEAPPLDISSDITQQLDKIGGGGNHQHSSMLLETLSEDMTRELETIKEMIAHLSRSKED